MAYIGDFRLGKTFDTKFTTVATTGAPTQLAGSPVISAYLDNNTTQLTAGITLTVDFDGVTGLNNVRVVATGGNGYATATNYQLVITTGTVGGTSVVGYVIAEFSIEARSALMPTTVDLTLDVSATGEAGVDWANVGGKTTVNALTNTSIITTQKVDIDTIKTNPVVNAGTVTFPTTATLASTTNLTAGTIATVSGNVNGSVGSVTGAVGSVTGAVGSVTGNIGGNVVGTVASVVGAVGSVTGAVGSVTGAVGSVTGNVGGNVVGSVATVTDITTTAQAELSAPPASNAAPLAKLNWMFILAKNKLTQTATTQIVKANDGSTTVGTSTVSDDGTTATRGVFS